MLKRTDMDGAGWSRGWRGGLVMAAVAVLLSGCGAAESLIGKFGGGGDEVLPGTREPVLQPNALGSAGESPASQPVIIPAAVTNADWPQAGGDASHTMHNVALNNDLKRAFAVSVGQGSDSYGRLTASPIVAAGRVFVLDSRAEVTAVSANDGATAWSRSLVPEGGDGTGAYGGGLATDGTHLFATTAFGDVVALDVSTGNEIWRKHVTSPIRGAPTLADGRVFFATVSNDTYALNAADGAQLWLYQGMGEQASIVASPSPAVAGGFVVVPHTTGELIAFRTDAGIPVWTESLSSFQTATSLANINDIAGRPAIADGQVYAIAHSGRLAAFDLKTGEPAWGQEMSGTQMPWIAGDYAFVIDGSSNMTAVERGGGGVRWTTALPGGGVWSGPVLAGGRLIAVSSNGTLASVSPQNGQVISTVDLGDEFYIAPVVARGTAYLLADSGTLVALR